MLKLAQSPNNTSFTQPSAAIVRNVLNTPIKDDLKMSTIVDDSDDLNTSTIMFEDTAMASYPKPSSDKPVEQLKFYMKQFASKNTKIKLHSLKQISDIIALDTAPVAAVIPELVSALRNYVAYDGMLLIAKFTR